MNKRELAAIVGRSVPTISNWIDKYPDFPVVDRGTNGKEWVFDPHAVRDFIATIEAADAQAAADRAARLQQLGLPFTDPGDASQPSAVAYTLDDIKRIQALDTLRQQRGFLVDVTEIRQQLTSAVARWSRANRAAIAQAARDHNLPDPVARAIRESLEEAQRQFVAALRQDADLFATPEPDAPGRAL